MTDWYLVLMIWGDAYGDADCNRLIRAAYRHSDRLQGVIVLTDRTDRALDPRAQPVAIPADFDRPDFKTGGLPVKIALFDIAALPPGAICVYVDLDSAIIGDLGPLAQLTDRAPIWTLPTVRARFGPWGRLIWRLSGGRRFGAGNSSIFAYRNGFSGNPTWMFRTDGTVFGRHAAPAVRMNDDHFIGWCCQGAIRPIPGHLAVRFRMEFLEVTPWLNALKARLRRKKRQSLAVVTFDGSLTKPETILSLPQNAPIIDHHGRRGRWNDLHLSGLQGRLAQAFRR